MTNAEAIKIINQYDCNFYWTDGERIPTEDLFEAFELAVKALDALTVDAVPLKPLCKWLSYYAAPPIIEERINIYDPGERERAWETVLKEIDWGTEPWTE